MEKDFDNWNIKKKELDQDVNPPSFNEREIWWCAIGKNIGYEAYGKGKDFTRPVLIIRKHGKFSFLGVPLTTKTKEKSNFYHPIICDGKESFVMLGQFKIYDARRLCNIIQQIGSGKHQIIRNAIINLI